jgi:hypothetical protein
MELRSLISASTLRRITLPEFNVKLAYIVSLIGFSIDQISTRIGLTFPNVFERNQATVRLLNSGTWLYVDFFLALFTILVSHMVISNWGFKHRKFIALFPLTFGALKLLTGFLNLNLIVSLI